MARASLYACVSASVWIEVRLLRKEGRGTEGALLLHPFERVGIKGGGPEPCDCETAKSSPLPPFWIRSDRARSTSGRTSCPRRSNDHMFVCAATRASNPAVPKDESTRCHPVIYYRRISSQCAYLPSSLPRCPLSMRTASDWDFTHLYTRVSKAHSRRSVQRFVYCIKFSQSRLPKSSSAKIRASLRLSGTKIRAGRVGDNGTPPRGRTGVCAPRMRSTTFLVIKHGSERAESVDNRDGLRFGPPGVPG